MLVWLDGRTNIKAKPQENFGRELMELFTMGVGTTPRPTSTPPRACSPAGICSRRPTATTDALLRVQSTTPTSTTPTRRSSRFRSIPNGSKTIPARRRPTGMQDGIDLHQRPGRASRDRPAARAEAVCVLRQRSSTRRIRRSSTRLAGTYYRERLRDRAVVRACCCSRRSSRDPANCFTRYSWPVGVRRAGDQGSRLDAASR